VQRKNKIRKLRRGDGSWCDDPNEMKGMTTEFFVDLFKADPVVSPNQVLDLILPKIIQEMNADLCREFSEKEISNAMFQIGTLKAPGLDGFPTQFYQQHWDIVSKDVVAAVQKFSKMGSNARVKRHNHCFNPENK
jgi:hypothetical protein